MPGGGKGFELKVEFMFVQSNCGSFNILLEQGKVNEVEEVNDYRQDDLLFRWEDPVARS